MKVLVSELVFEIRANGMESSESTLPEQMRNRHEKSVSKVDDTLVEMLIDISALLLGNSIVCLGDLARDKSVDFYPAVSS